MNARKLLASSVVAVGLVLATPTVADARPVPEPEPVYCGPGYYTSNGVTCKPVQTNDCVVWWKPWTWAKTDCVS